MNIGNRILIFSLGLAVFAASCKKPEPDETTCVTPAAPVATNDSPKAVGQVIQLSATNVEGATYSWTGPNKFTSTLQNPTITYSNNNILGEYSVVAIVNGCSSAKAFTYITGCDTPSVATNSPVVQGQTLSLSAQVIPGATYSWTKVGNPAFSSNEPSFSLTNVSDTVAGTYEVVISYNGCTTPSRKVNVVVVPAQPKITGALSYITGGTLTLTATSTTAGVSYRWSRPVGPDTVTQTLTIPNVTRRHKGEYKVVAFKNNLVSEDSTTTVDITFNTTIGCNGVTSVTGPNGVVYSTVEIVSGTTKQCWIRQDLKETSNGNDSLWEYDKVLPIGVGVEQQGMCPTGFHVAGDNEWSILTSAAGNSSDPLKAVQTGSTGTNTTGFTMGFTGPTVRDYWVYTVATPTAPIPTDFVYIRQFKKADNSITKDLVFKKNASNAPLSKYVRCIKD